MNLIIYFPKEKEGAPLNVAKNIVKYLHKNRNKLNFDVKILYEEKNANYFNNYFESLNIDQIKYLNAKEDVIHFPLTPCFAFKKMPSLFNYFCNRNFKIISNVHGEFREELYYRMKNGSWFESLFPIINYFFWPRFQSKSNCIIVNSKYSADILKQKYNIHKSVKIIPNGIDESWFLKSNEKKTFDKISMFSHGRLAIEKGCIPLIKAMRRRSNEIKLYIAGEGPLERKMKYFIKKNELSDYIELLGYVPIEELKSYLQSVDAAIYCSLYEPFSLAVLEALSNTNGSVFFSKNTGLYNFANENERKKLFTFNPTVNEIKEIIETISTNSYSNVHTTQKQFAKKFLWNKVIRQYIDMYDEIFDR